MKNSLIIILAFLPFLLKAQENSSSIQNTTLGESLVLKESKLSIGGYGQVDYNQSLSSETFDAGNLDVHRIVMLFTYKFNEKTNLVSEIEYEHVKEVYIEQAYLEHKFSDLFQLRAGLMLVPMGIINEYHEPTLYNGVERPLLENKLNPTTWREIGIGFTGRSNEIGIKYQLYLINGLKSYSDKALFSSSGYRSGRQKGAESIITSPNITGRVEYYGTLGLKLGISALVGKTQSELYDGIDLNNDHEVLTADSSVLGMSMVGFDVQYRKKGFESKLQYYYTHLQNTQNYNEFAGGNVSSSMHGYYVEAGYNILYSTQYKNKLVPYVRYSVINLQASKDADFTPEENNIYQIIETGISYQLSEGTILKADYQWYKTQDQNDFSNNLNLGIGFMF